MDRTHSAPPAPGSFDRRTFFRYGAAAGTAAASAGVLTTVAGPAQAAEHRVGRASVEDFEFSEMSIAQLQAAMRAGSLTSEELTRAYLDRIEAIDHNGIHLNSVIETNPAAVAIARALDQERQAGAVRGPLHGIPVLVKDNIATHDAMETTAGSFALLGSEVPRDAFVVKQLRDAGAIILGKANLSEWANFRGFQSTSGWSGRAGVGLNPYALNRTECGSSAGSAAAVAASLVATALGTETDGSIVCPSGTNSCVGIKATLGLASRSGVIPIAHSQDMVGPISRTVEDAAITLGAITGIDTRDPATAASKGHTYRNYRQFLDAGALKGKRLGVWRDGIFGFSPETDAVGEAALAALADLGAVLVDPADIPNVADIFESEFTVLLYEFKHDLEVYLRGLVRSRVRTLADVIAFNSAHADLELMWFGQELMEISESFGPLTEPAYLDALAKSKRLARRGILRTLNDRSLDAIVSVTNEAPWTIDLVTGDHFTVPLAPSTPPAVSGFPHITVPAGYAFGKDLPVGLSFLGRPWDEPNLLGYAYAFEQGTKARRAPNFLWQVAAKDFVERTDTIPGGGAAAAATRISPAPREAPTVARRIGL
ncbi:MAG: amidase [Actinobacteria bacterium]|nr:amidase [Actinomycetota bacterium]